MYHPKTISPRNNRFHLGFLIRSIYLRKFIRDEKMKKILILLLFSIFIFNSCKKDSSNPVNTNTVPTAPTLLYPNNLSTDIATSPTLSWNASYGATSYTLQV